MALVPRPRAFPLTPRSLWPMVWGVWGAASLLMLEAGRTGDMAILPSLCVASGTAGATGVALWRLYLGAAYPCAIWRWTKVAMAALLRLPVGVAALRVALRVALRGAPVMPMGASALFGVGFAAALLLVAVVAAAVPPTLSGRSAWWQPLAGHRRRAALGGW